MRNALFLAVCLIGLSGCSGSGGGSGSSGFSTSASNATVTGPWQAVATSTVSAGAKVVVEANLNDTSGSISSTAFVVIGSCVQPTTGTVTGTVNGNNITLSASYGGVTVSLTGTVSGQTISGTYTASGACGSDSGTWTAQQMPEINGNYSGSVVSNSNPGQPINLTATLSTNSALIISGTASVSSTCFNQLTLNGNQVGGAAQITATDPQGDSVLFLFASNDASFGTITGAYSVTAGNCAGDSGTGTLTKQ